MQPADEWSTFVLQTAHGRLVSLARHIPGPQAAAPPAAAQPYRKSDDPFAPLLDAIEAVPSEHCELHNPPIRLEEAGSVTPAPQLPQDNDPLDSPFNALEPINRELTDSGARLARLEDIVFQFLPRPPRLVNSPSATATVHAAQSRLVQRAVQRA